MTNRRTFWFDQTHEIQPNVYAVNVVTENEPGYVVAGFTIAADSVDAAHYELAAVNRRTFGHSPNDSLEIVTSSMFRARTATRFEFAIKTTGAAFRAEQESAPAELHEEAERLEVAMLLRDAARKLEEGSTARVVLDSNGNTVGRWELTR
jgi:hypothetical protein